MILGCLIAVWSERKRALINLAAAGQVRRGCALSWVTFLGLSASIYGTRYIFNAVSCPGEEGDRELLSSVRRRAVASIARPRHAASSRQERKGEIGPCCFPPGRRGCHRLALRCAPSPLLSSNTRARLQLDPGVAPYSRLRLCERIGLK